MAQPISAAIIYKEYQITASTTASAAQLLAIANPKAGRLRIILEAVTSRIVFKFGDSSVVASATVTSNALADDNFSIPAGAIAEIDLPSDVAYKYVSVITPSGSGTAIIKLARF